MEKTKKYIARKNRRGLFGFFSFRAAIINVDVDIEMILKNKSRKGLALVQIRWKLRWWLIGKCGFLWCVVCTATRAYTYAGEKNSETEGK